MMFESDTDPTLFIHPPEDIYVPIPPKTAPYRNPIVISVETSPLEILYNLSPELKGFSSLEQKISKRLYDSNNPYSARSPNFKRLDLVWEKNNLQLQAYDDYNEPTQIWTFSPLKMGTYQFRFIYDHPQQLESKKLTSNWINLHLINLTENNAIEANNVRFETIITQSHLTFPSENEVISIEFGIRLTNQGNIPYRFDLQRFFPEFLDANENFIQIGINRNHVRDVHKSDIPLIMPQDTIEFLIKNKLIFVSRLDCYAIQGSDNLDYGGYWNVNLQEGIYKLRFNDLCYGFSKNMILSSTGRTQVNDFWVGKIVSPFSLIEFQNCSNS